jgi:HNH endonuclease
MPLVTDGHCERFSRFGGCRPALSELIIFDDERRSCRSSTGWRGPRHNATFETHHMAKSTEFGGCYAANINWNSDGWSGAPKGPQRSGFAYVDNGGTPGESWNFDFGNRRNTRTTVYGYVPGIERAAADVATIFLTTVAPEEQRFIVGLYVDARILEDGPPWPYSEKPRRDGMDRYANLSVPRGMIAACVQPRLVPWNIERHYGRSYGKRQWPGRQNFLSLDRSLAQTIAKDLVTAHLRWAKTNPSSEDNARRVIAVASIVLGAPTLENLSEPSPVESELPDSDVVMAERKRIEAKWLLRNAPQLRRLKEAYGYVCQIDPQHRFEQLDAPPYVEVHHLKPISEGGILADPQFSNCIVVCPSCHVLLQSRAMWIDPVDGRKLRHFRGDARYHGKRIKLIDGHQLDRKVLRELSHG